MKEIKNCFIDKNLVHKKNNENVFLYNLRRCIPGKIEKNIFEKEILPFIEMESRNYLLDFYKLADLKSVAGLNEDKSGYYVLKNCLIEIESMFVDGLDMKDSEMNFFSSHYQKDPETGKYVLIKIFDDNDENKLLKLLNFKHLIISNSSKVMISKILEPFIDKLGILPEKNLFFANMYVNPCHVFFFEHPNEHVPGIMLIETLRQFVIACCHEFGKIPQSGAQVILDTIEAQFLSYADLNYPIEIKGRVAECRYNNLGYRDYLDIHIGVFQNNNHITDFKLKGKSISNKLYERIRRKKVSEIENHRFQLYPQFNSNCSLKCTGDKKYLNANLLDLSASGFKLNYRDIDKIRNERDGFEFFLFYEEVGFIHGSCKNMWINEKTMESGFKITDISDEDKNKLFSSIARYFYLMEEREAYVN